MFRIRPKWLCFVLMGLFVGLLFACGEQVEDVNRVQPHYVKKSDLEGTWYYRQTIVERPPQFYSLFEGIEGALEKIRFEVRERQLIAYRIHPNVEGLETDRTTPGAEYQGEPVAIFNIGLFGHFDIMREYNTATGEQNNVLIEDRFTRPWYDREYLRVDWGSNILEGGVDFGGMVSAIATASYYDREHDPYDPDRLRVYEDFIFFTNNYTVYDGQLSCLNGFGSPSGAGGYGNCGSVEVKVRNAFWKIDAEEARQFEPISYIDEERLLDDESQPIKYVTATVEGQTIDLECSDAVLAKLGPRFNKDDCHFLTWKQMGRFGYFRSERYAYDRRVGGGHDVARQVYANHHQMWAKTRRADGTRIPLNQRRVRPIVYYLNTNFPDDLKATAAKLGANWDDVFMEAAMAATGKTEEELRAQLREDTAPSALFLDADDRKAGALFQVRDNNCSIAGVESYLARNPGFEDVVTNASRFEGLKPGNLERVCSAIEYFSRERGAETFTWQQMGDLRNSYLWWVNEEQPNGPLGYGPSSADIETGRIISGNAHVYGAAIDQYARSAADVVRAINGDLDFSDIIDGDHLRDWMRRGSDMASMPLEPTEEMRAILSERIGTPFMDGEREFEDEHGHPDMGKVINHMHRRLAQPVANDPIVAAMERPQDRKSVLLEAIAQDPEMKGLFTDPEMLKVAGAYHGWRPGMEQPEGMEELALELSVDPDAIGKKVRERQKFFAEKNVYLAEFFDDSVMGQAQELKGKSAEEVYAILRREIFEAVMLHEIGHTVGMTHNFEASFDALNYQKEFWEIQQEGLTAEEKLERRQPEHRYASIMDYGSRFNSDTKGLGRYDFATIKFLYGQSLEEFEDDVPVPGHLDALIPLTDYTRLPELLGGDVENLWKRKNVSIESSIDALRSRLNANTALFLSDGSSKRFAVDRTVPYGYCADFFNGDLRCKTWDEGSNHTEAVQAAIQKYWNYYAFNSFRRGRDEGAFLNGFFGRINRMMDYLIYPWQFYYFYDAYPVDVRDDLLRASTLGLNFVNEVVGTPEPGEYCEYITAVGTDASGEEGGACITNSDCADDSVCRSRQCVVEPDVYLPSYYFSQAYRNSCRKVDVQLGDGRDQYFDYSADHLYKIDYLGSYFEKSNLLSALFFDSTRFFRVTDESDTRRFTIGYYRAFREEIIKMVRDLVLGTLVNGSITNDSIDFLTDSIHARIVQPDGTLVAQPMIDPARFGSSDRATAAPAPQLYTPVPYNLATRAAQLGAIYNTTQYDQELDLIEYLTVSELGSGDDRVTDGREQAIFVNPNTGQGYVATQTWDGRSISYEFLERLNVFVEADWKPALEAYQANPSDEDAMFFFDRLDRQMNEFIEMVDLLREMRSMMDFAQGGGWR